METVLLLRLLLHQSAMAVHAAANTASGTAVSVSTEWGVEEWAIAHSFSPLPPLPLDPTNALAENLQAAQVGHRLFFDPRLSPPAIACSTCHQSDYHSEWTRLPEGLPAAMSQREQSPNSKANKGVKTR